MERNLEITKKNSQIKDMKSLSSLLKELMESPDPTIAEIINHLNRKYRALQSQQSSYIQLDNNAVLIREFEKHDSFKTSLLNSEGK